MQLTEPLVADPSNAARHWFGMIAIDFDGTHVDSISDLHTAG